MNYNSSPSFLVLAGDGINCERETARAFAAAGARGEIVHINDLLNSPKRLERFDGLAIPGGFSFGDELGSGQILALKIKHGLGAEFDKFVERKKPIIGICNGFQVLCKLGLLPDYRRERQAALVENAQGKFVNRWVSLHRPVESNCVWTQGLDRFRLPVRNGEGRVMIAQDQALKSQNQVALEYTDPTYDNGSHRQIAGLSDSRRTHFRFDASSRRGGF